jgi:hypothetical protein
MVLTLRKATLEWIVAVTIHLFKDRERLGIMIL